MRAHAKWVLIGLTLLFAALVVALTAGGAIQSTPPGIPDPGALTHWGLPIIKALIDISAIATVGLLMVPAVLEPSVATVLSRRGFQLTRLAHRTAWGWAIFAAIGIVFTLSDLIAISPATALDPGRLGDFVWNIPQGRSLAAEAVLALVVAVVAAGAVNSARTIWALVISLTALIPPTLSGHAAAAGSHELAVASIAVHVLAATVWIGGVLGLIALYSSSEARQDGVALTLARFSILAGVCWAVVGVSGIVNAAIRVHEWANLATPYGGLILTKATAFIVLGGFGLWHRRTSIAAIRDKVAPNLTDFVRIAGVELLIMLATVGVAVGLSRSPTPVGEATPTDPAFEVLGTSLPPTPTVARVVFGWSADGILLVLLLAAALLYAAGLDALRRRGDKWPVGRTTAWYAGLLVAAWSTVGGLGEYGQVMFSLHMVSHMTLSMVAPIGLVLGAPTTLALRTLPGRRVPKELGLRQVLQKVLQSRFVSVISHPVVAAVIFVGSLYALYFTSLFGFLMRSHLGHTAMEIHFLAAGSLFFWTLVGVDPAPHKLHPLARIGLLLMVMPFHAFFAIALMNSTTVLAEPYYLELRRPYATDLLADQHLGAGIAWAISELPIVLVMAAVFVQWVRADMREAARLDRAADRAADQAVRAQRPDIP